MRRMNMNYRQSLQKRLYNTASIFLSIAFNKTPSYLIGSGSLSLAGSIECAPFSPRAFVTVRHVSSFSIAYRYGALKSDFLAINAPMRKFGSELPPPCLEHESPKLCNPCMPHHISNELPIYYTINRHLIFISQTLNHGRRIQASCYITHLRTR